MRTFLALAVACLSGMTAYAGADISGVVRANGKPQSGVLVSNGISIVKTDSKGRYKIKSDKAAETVFVITPSGYVANSTDKFQPDFWAPLNNNGKSEKHDFDLIPQDQSKFEILFTTDQHLTNDSSKDDLYYYENVALPRINEVAADCAAKGPVYGVNIGDISHDLFWYSNNMPLDSVINYVTRTGFPVANYSVSGNHDNDGAITGEDVDNRSAWLYRKILGPSHFSVNIGNTHWVFFDNIIYKNLPGGKVATGIKGDRSYNMGLTAQQMEWVKKDIAMVPDSVRLYLVCHAPMIFNRAHETLFTDYKQVDTLDVICNRFDNVTVFSGHAHKSQYQRSKNHPRFEQYVLCATSGDMWQTAKNFRVMGNDGCDAGVMTASFCPNEAPQYVYHTYDTSVDACNQFRVYDLNEVGKYYATDPGIKYEKEIYPKRIDYSDPKFENVVMINYWGDREGRHLVVLEDGKQLEVTKQPTFEDPLYNIAYYVPQTLENKQYKKSHDKIGSAHMFTAKASSATSTITVQSVDNNGNVLQTQTIVRPKAFNKDIR